MEKSRRPWGSYEVLAEGPAHKVKTIAVAPGKRLSYQRHQHRAEHWFIVAGEGLVTLDGAQLRVTVGQSVDVPRGACHRIENVGLTELVFVEVQHGVYFGEDDIERLEDDFGRVAS